MRFMLLFMAGLMMTAPSNADQSVVMTRFSNRTFADGGTQLHWDKVNDRWQSGTRQVHFEIQCTNLLQQQQLYSLQKMHERGFLSAEQLQYYSELALKLVPDQVTFFELLGDRSKNTSISLTSNTFTQANQTQATLWTISGQRWSIAHGMQHQTLPWMLEEKWRPIATKLDRKKYPFVWEWGRAGQENADDIHELLELSTMNIYREVRALGGKIEDAYVSIHSISPVHTRTYLKTFPDTLFSDGDGKVGDSILLIPLTHLLEIYPISKSSKLIFDLKSLSRTGWADSFFADLVDVTRTTLYSEIDFHGVKQMSPHPLVLQDYSNWGANSVHVQLKQTGLPESSIQPMMQKLLSTPFSRKLNGTNRYVDASETKGASHYSYESNAIEISGLDPAQLKDDPHYLYRVLFAVATRTVIQAQEIFGQQASIKQIWLSLIQSQTPITMITRDAQLEKLIRAMNPIHEERMITDKAENVPAQWRKMLGDDWGTTSHIFYFDFGRILEMTNDPKLEEVFIQSMKALRLDRFYREHQLLDLDIY